MTQAAKGTLGTFGGVFTPSVLTILGLILFLRLGFVVGHGGLAQALLIIAIANAISVLTSISLAAIATNLKVKGGGDYYLISRTLGLEFGGAIGIVLFLAQSISVGFYCIGFGEAMASLLPDLFWARTQIIAFMAVGGLFIVSWLGAQLATKLQYLIMAALAAALVSFFLGGLQHWDTSLLLSNWGNPGPGQDFWIVFAVFFPAVTGFTQGVSMSGDLKDPGKSLPWGTFAAVGVSIVVYLLAAAVFAANLPLEVLRSDYTAMQRVATREELIYAGVIAATLSSALASFMGAPRILQALAADRIFPLLRPFAQGSGSTNNPRRGIALAGVIAAGVVGLGELNLIASLVSMFFLISYGLLNYATYYEARIQSPSFRPRFRHYDRRLSLLGAIACLGAMLAVNIYAGLLALALLFSIYQYLLRTAPQAGWADSQRSYHLQQIREHILAAAKEAEHPRHWRPQILAFSDEPANREQLLHFARWVEGRSGLTTVVRIVEGQGMKGLKAREEAKRELEESMRKIGTEAFPLVIAAPDLGTGVYELLQGYGIGPLQGNTVLLNSFHADPPGRARSVDPARNLRTVFRLGYNIIMLDGRLGKWEQLSNAAEKDRRIDIWWWGGATSRLMVLLAFLMTRDAAWSQAGLRVLAVVGEGEAEKASEALQEVLANYRIDAQTEIITKAHASSIVEHSKDASLVFLPFTFRATRVLGPFGGDLNWLLVRLPVTAMVLAAEDIDLEAEPEEGEIAEQARAVQALEDAKQRLKDAEKEAEAARAKAEAKQKEADEAHLAGRDSSELQQKKAEAEEARKAAEEAGRKAAKAKAKLLEAEKEAARFDVSLAEEKNGKDRS